MCCSTYWGTFTITTFSFNLHSHVFGLQPWKDAEWTICNTIVVHCTRCRIITSPHCCYIFTQYSYSHRSTFYKSVILTVPKLSGCKDQDAGCQGWNGTVYRHFVCLLQDRRYRGNQRSLVWPWAKHHEVRIQSAFYPISVTCRSIILITSVTWCSSFPEVDNLKFHLFNDFYHFRYQ